MFDSLNFINVPEILNKFKNLQHFLNINIVNEPKDNLTKVVTHVINEFFEIIHRVDDIRRSELLDLLAKFCIKIKQVHLLNIAIVYFKIIEMIREEIRKDYLREFNFCIFTDMIVTCVIKQATTNGQYSWETQGDSEENLFKSFDLIDFHVLIKGSSVETHDYLMQLIERIIFIYSKSPFHKYQLSLAVYPEPCGLKIFSKEKLAYTIGKQKSELDLKSQCRRNIKDLFLNLEDSIKVNFDRTIRPTKKFKNTFIRFYKKIRSNPCLTSKIKQTLPFGSITQFSFNISSDLEITLITEDMDEQQRDSFMKQLNEFLSNEYTDFSTRSTKRTTLISFFDDKASIKIELTLDNVFGLLNSTLIRNYFLLDSRGIILINAIKDWSKKRKINGNYDGYLSSYCYTLMLIYFLQRTVPPVLPIASASSRNLKNLELTESHHYVDFGMLKLDKDWKSPNDSPVSVLLFQFFVFYYNLFDESEYSIDITSKAAVYRYNDISYLNSRNNGRTSYCFIDPFDYTYNPGYYLEKGSPNEEKYRNELKLAIEKILKGDNIFAVD